MGVYIFLADASVKFFRKVEGVWSMKWRNWIAVSLVLVLMSALSVTSLAKNPTVQDSEISKQLSEVRQVTAKYHDVQNALDDGFIPLSPCVEVPALGGMGVHYGHPDRIANPPVLSEPDILVYAPHGPQEKLKLVAVEYFQEGGDRPEMFGLEFDDGPYPGSYALHVWAWNPNPSGMFAPFNPRVSCPL